MSKIVDINHGVYIVGQTPIKSKTLALYEATKTNQPVKWDFFEQVFDRLDWAAPISQSLTQLYADRARQLRDTYDYLILSFSGGSDSTNILKTFLNNNIKLDEIFVYWPIRATSGIYTPNSADRRPENYLSEWDLAIKPQLEYIQKYHSDIKITVFDTTDELVKDLTEDRFLSAGNSIGLGFFIRHWAHGAVQRHDHGNIGVIYGSDKPQLAIKDHKIYAYFLDSLTTNAYSIVNESNQTIELFYWTKSMPELAIKSAQTLAFFLQQNKNLQHYFYLGPQSAADKDVKDELIKSVIYQDTWDSKIFQAGKDISIFKSEYDYWIFERHQNERFVKAWEYHLDSYLPYIDSKYFRFNNVGQKISYVGMPSPLRYICSA
jgi:hypothetical protein